MKHSRTAGLLLGCIVLLAGIGAWAASPSTKPADSLLTPANNVLVLIDHQPQMAFAVQSHDIVELRNNVTALAKAAKVFKVPTILTTVAEEQATNPFFRVGETALAAAVGLAGASADKVFAALREAKNRF